MTYAGLRLRPLILLPLLAAISAEATYAQAQDCVTTLVLIRHAERSGEHLIAAGERRAALLPHVFEHTGIAAVFTSDAIRTVETARPLARPDRPICSPGSTDGACKADANNPVPQQRDGNEAEYVNFIFAEGRFRCGTVLVVGHQETIFNLMTAFRHPNPPGDLPENDQIFILTRLDSGPAHLVMMQYGDPI